MIRDITIGQYYPEDSVMHKLDPRVKIVGTMMFVISAFLFTSIWTLLLASGVLMLAIKVSKVPIQFILKGLKGIILLLMATALLNLFFTVGRPIFQWGIISITKEGIRDAVIMCLRFVNIIIGSQIMTLTTTPLRLADGIEKLLLPLKRFNAPVHEITLMISITLRFIPILTEEADKIMKAQMARGADFESGGLIKKAKALLPLLVPLIVSAFRRGDDLAMAMEARNYTSGAARTKLNPLKYTRQDKIGYGVIVAYVVILIMIGKWI